MMKAENQIIINDVLYKPVPRIGCEGCALEGSCGTVLCSGVLRKDGTNVIWVRAEKQLSTLTQELNNALYSLRCAQEWIRTAQATMRKEGSENENSM